MSAASLTVVCYCRFEQTTTMLHSTTIHTPLSIKSLDAIVHVSTSPRFPRAQSARSTRNRRVCLQAQLYIFPSVSAVVGSLHAIVHIRQGQLLTPVSRAAAY